MSWGEVRKLQESLVRLPLRQEIITANTEFIVPDFVKSIRVTATSAGASGGDGGQAGYYTQGYIWIASGGAGGTHGTFVVGRLLSVKPKEKVSITVGYGNTIIQTLGESIALTVPPKGENGKSYRVKDGTAYGIAGGVGVGWGGSGADCRFLGGNVGGVQFTSSVATDGKGDFKGFAGYKPPEPGYGISGGGGASGHSVFLVNYGASLLSGGIGSGTYSGTIDGSYKTVFTGGTGGRGFGAGGGGGAGTFQQSNVSVNGGAGAPGIVILEW